MSKSGLLLETAQLDLLQDRMNVEKIERVKSCSADVFYWNGIDEHIPMQKSKIDWPRLGDGNNA